MLILANNARLRRNRYIFQSEEAKSLSRIINTNVMVKAEISRVILLNRIK